MLLKYVQYPHSPSDVLSCKPSRPASTSLSYVSSSNGGMNGGGGIPRLVCFCRPQKLLASVYRGEIDAVYHCQGTNPGSTNQHEKAKDNQTIPSRRRARLSPKQVRRNFKSGGGEAVQIIDALSAVPDSVE